MSRGSEILHSMHQWPRQLCKLSSRRTGQNRRYRRRLCNMLASNLISLIVLSTILCVTMFMKAIESVVILVLAVHLSRTSKRTGRADPADAPADAVGAPVAEQPAPDARAVARATAGRADALLGVVAVALAGQDARGRVYARALRGRLSAAVYARRGRTSRDAVDRRAEDAERKGLAAAAEEGRGREGADRGVRVKGAATAALGGGREG